MLTRADATGTRPVTLVEASLPATAVGQPRQESLERLLQLTLGREYQAQVLSRLTDGSFLVRIDNAAASMKLPPGTKPGDTLDMTLLATQPRPTFLLGRAEAGVTAASLSNAGRLIGNMLQLAGQDGARPAVTGTVPLVPSAAATPTQIAGAMRNAVSMSGVFYESHVAQWAAGARAQVELLREPAIKRLPVAAPPLAGAPAAQGEDAIPDTLPRLQNPAQTMQPHANPAARTAALPQSRTDAIEAIAPKVQDAPDAPLLDSARLLNQQLDTLEQRRLLWQGELFPGQSLEWEINDETPRNKADQAEPDAEQVWSSSVRFSMPSLGAIAATVRLVGEHVQVQLTTGDDDTADLLRRHGPLLADSLDAAGATLDVLSVRREE
ncbi:hypothetical protein GCM10007205_10930 [Oxalicibacterium flavum]|uniref:Flagellar hook-length control protein-like C-terminal domain-containing protein n=1 Tax=Oxalicibacterium flavum TaxID=179467 RepID=A0A8J2ULT0_9BURK|nr:flagellar hook-length control protein FliK [Oxalicibacterium flavum]GGC03545.1 hypothetical protein GCM10007205_10930 [Oxalicibacterium flavum]